jgi:hypothetical protein
MGDDCIKHIGLEKDINSLMEWKKQMTDPEGTIEHVWQSINRKISLPLSITLMTVILGIIGVTFTLDYQTQREVLKELGNLKMDVAVIQTHLEIGP